MIRSPMLALLLTVAVVWHSRPRLCLTSAFGGTQPGAAVPQRDEALWARLHEIDSRAGRIRSLSASFEQKKSTALLRKPLVSTGRIRIKATVMRWDTDKPEPSVLLIGEREARIYYPDQKLLEVYPLDQRLGELAASPLPRLDALAKKFSFEQIPTKDLDPKAEPSQFLALRLVPTDAALREHVKEVRVLLDVRGAYIVAAEMIDADGDRTVLTFAEVKPNADVGDLELHVPAGTKATRPLEGAGGERDSKEHVK